MRVEYRAAWLPFDPEHGQTPEALALAVEWVEQECATQGVPGVLFVSQKPIGAFYPEPIRSFADRYEGTTKKGSAPDRRGYGPVLAHALLFDALDYAQGFARGSSLCATEWPGAPLAGWAAARGALNLQTGETTSPPSDAAVELLDHLRMVGNNGWGDVCGKRDARQLLPKLHAAAPELTADYVTSYLFGLFDVSPRAAKDMHDMATEAGM